MRERSRRLVWLPLLALVACGAVGAASAGAATTYYVDAAAPGGGIGTAGSPFNTIRAASLVAIAGDTIRIQGGPTVYDEMISTRASGTASSPIRYQGARGADGTLPTLVRNSGPSRQCIVLQHDYTEVSNVSCYGQGGAGYAATCFTRFVMIYGGAHNLVTLSKFQGAICDGSAAGIEIRSDMPGLRFATGNKFTLNELVPLFHNPNRGILVWEYAWYNLFDSNTVAMYGGGTVHSAVEIKGSYNVVRNNLLANPTSTTLALFRPDTDLGYSLEFELTQYNVIEGNSIAFTPATGNAIQIQAPHTIVRRNKVYLNDGPAISIGRSSQSAESAKYLNHNRIFHNVFYRNLPAHGISPAVLGIRINCDAPNALNTEDNAFENNVLFRNRLSASPPFSHLLVDMGFSVPPSSCTSPPVGGVRIYGPGGTRFANNSVRRDSATSIAEPLIHVEEPLPGSSDRSVSDADALYSPLFAQNLSADPLFVAPDAGTPDFRLQPNSPLIDAGRLLAHVTALVGSSPYTVVQLDDDGYFSDGYGVVPGDDVKFASSGLTRRILLVDRSTHRITLDAGVPALLGEGVSLPWNGNAPDIGAVEF